MTEYNQIEPNLIIPLTAAGAFIGYTISGKRIKGAVIGGIITLATAAYMNQKLNDIPEKYETPEYEIIEDNENNKNK